MRPTICLVFLLAFIDIYIFHCPLFRVAKYILEGVLSTYDMPIKRHAENLYLDHVYSTSGKYVLWARGAN
jgi:hypothetical protein